MTKYTYGSLFAGVGGFDLGLDSAGWDCKFQVEWDKHCQSVLQRHWPDVPKHWDVSEVDGSKLTPVDLITFGSPCQDLSVAGKRAGLQGNRSNLFFQAARIIKEMRNATANQFPRFAIWENVPGALTSNKGEDFAEVINQMVNIGALGIEWHVLDAQWFGVPQRRRRVFLVACFDSSAIERSKGKILPVPEDSAGNIKKSRKKRKQSSRTAQAGSGEPVLYGKTGFSKYEQGGVTISASDYKRPDMNFVLHDSEMESVIPFVKAKRAQSNQDDESWKDGNVSPTLNLFDNTGESRATVLIVDGTRHDDFRVYDDGLVPTLKHRMGTGGGQVPLVTNLSEHYSFHTKQDPISESDLSICLTEQMGVGVAIPIQGTIIGRSDTAGPQGKGYGEIGDPSYTLDTVSQHGVCTSDLVLRRLTPLECERLMGFPDNHTQYTSDGKIVADSNRYKMCGNAVASPVAEWIGKNLKRLL